MCHSQDISVMHSGPTVHDQPAQEILMIATGNRGLLKQHKQFLNMRSETGRGLGFVFYIESE